MALSIPLQWFDQDGSLLVSARREQGAERSKMFASTAGGIGSESSREG